MSKTQAFLKNKQTSISQCIIIPGLLEQDGKVTCCKPRENTSNCRASGTKSSSFPRDPSVALLTAAWHDCTCIKPHLNGKPTFSSQECKTVRVGSLETLAMLEFPDCSESLSYLQIQSSHCLINYLAMIALCICTTWINGGPFRSNCGANRSVQWETKTWTASANREVRAAQ